MMTVGDVLKHKIKVTSTKKLTVFKECCHTILKYRDQKALNYAVNYARYGLSISNVEEAQVQALYILNNITHWRGEEAKAVRQALKEFSKS